MASTLASARYTLPARSEYVQTQFTSKGLPVTVTTKVTFRQLISARKYACTPKKFLILLDTYHARLSYV
eukprot:1590459-Pyramimonas_sp.AAC.1